MNRREFIHKSLLTLALGQGAPSLLSKTALAAQSRDKILVVINLFGGNDQLNTLVPYRNELYYRLRPNSPSRARRCWISEPTERT